MTLEQAIAVGSFLIAVLGFVSGLIWRFTKGIHSKFTNFEDRFKKEMKVIVETQTERHTAHQEDIALVREQIRKVDEENNKIKNNYNSKFDRVDRRFDTVEERITDVREALSETREQMIQGLGDLKTLIIEKRS